MARKNTKKHQFEPRASLLTPASVFPTSTTLSDHLDQRGLKEAKDPNLLTDPKGIKDLEDPRRRQT
jgi:hypothetical protein